MTASKERKKVAVRLIANGSIIIMLLIKQLGLGKMNHYTKFSIIILY
jgi:hypothetical protein